MPSSKSKSNEAQPAATSSLPPVATLLELARDIKAIAAREPHPDDDQRIADGYALVCGRLFGTTRDDWRSADAAAVEALVTAALAFFRCWRRLPPDFRATALVGHLDRREVVKGVVLDDVRERTAPSAREVDLRTSLLLLAQHIAVSVITYMRSPAARDTAVGSCATLMLDMLPVGAEEHALLEDVWNGMFAILAGPAKTDFARALAKRHAVRTVVRRYFKELDPFPGMGAVAHVLHMLLGAYLHLNVMEDLDEKDALRLMFFSKIVVSDPAVSSENRMSAVLVPYSLLEAEWPANAKLNLDIVLDCITYVYIADETGTLMEVVSATLKVTEQMTALDLDAGSQSSHSRWIRGFLTCLLISCCNNSKTLPIERRDSYLVALLTARPPGGQLTTATVLLGAQYGDASNRQLDVVRRSLVELDPPPAAGSVAADAVSAFVADPRWRRVLCGNQHCGQTWSAPLKMCSRCHALSYCSQECQKADWPNHKKICKKT